MSTLTRSGVARALVLLIVLMVTGTNAHAQARPAALPDTADPLARAMNAEERGDIKAAATAYRSVILRALALSPTDGDQIDMALLGLERVWAEGGVRDSILPVVQRVLLLRRTDPVARGIQLRTLVALGQDEAASVAFTDWRRSVPNDASPYREYTRLLLQIGRAKAADSVLTEAQRMLGTARDLSGEVAQLNIALERWKPAAVAYRAALVEQPWMETSALFQLQKTPVAQRDTIRAVLSATPILLAPRRLLANLEWGWGEPRRAWTSLSQLTVDDSTVAEWRNFGERAEFSDSWIVARDVWTTVFDRRGDLESARRAANATLKTGDPAAALALIERAWGTRSGAAVVKALLPMQVTALGELGRAADAQKLIDANAQFIDERVKASLLKPIVDAWLRAGNLEQARIAAKNADLLDDDETAGWLALYEGDLAGARKRLVRLDTRRGAQIDALALLARTRAATSPALGAAFLTLAKRDSSGAVAKFVALADSMGDAAPAFLATAARIEDLRGPSAAARALTIWKRIRTDYPKSPEAPEAALAWAHTLATGGDLKGAVAQLESMLTDYTDTAMAPQARRELERLRALIPPGGS